MSDPPFAVNFRIMLPRTFRREEQEQEQEQPESFTTLEAPQKRKNTKMADRTSARSYFGAVAFAAKNAKNAKKEKECFVHPRWYAGR